MKSTIIVRNFTISETNALKDAVRQCPDWRWELTAILNASRRTHFVDVDTLCNEAWYLAEGEDSLEECVRRFQSINRIKGRAQNVPAQLLS